MGQSHGAFLFHAEIQKALETQQFRQDECIALLDSLAKMETIEPAFGQMVIDYLKSIRWDGFAQAMVKVISDCESVNALKVLVRACWENGSDFSAHLPFFLNMICTHQDIELAIEVFSLADSTDTEKMSAGDKENCLQLLTNKQSKLTIAIRQLMLPLSEKFLETPTTYDHKN